VIAPGCHCTPTEAELTVSVDLHVLADTPPLEPSDSAAATDGDIEADGASAEAAEDQTTTMPDAPRTADGRWKRILAYWLLPGLALNLAAGAAYLKWEDGSARQSQLAAVQSVAAASDTTVALLSYRPDTVEKDLTAARDRLTGNFKDAYTQLVHDVVIPGAKQKQISALATVPAAASVTASPTHAVVLLFVDQAITVGNDAPSNTTSSIRVNLDKIHDRWLISQFDPV
jgi:Mce-associated membrane protein